MGERLRPTLAGACFTIIVILGLTNTVLRWFALHSGDSFMHIRIGQEILRSGQVPTTDSLSFTHFGAPYLAHEWLFEVLLELLYRAFTIDALVVFSAVSVAALFWLLATQAKRRGGSWRGILPAFIPFIFLVLPMYRARPHIITALGFAVGAWVLNGTAWRKRDWRVLAAFAAGLALWTNFHAGSMIFLGVLAIETLTGAGLAVAGKDTWSNCRWTLGVLAAACLGSLVTPYGIRVPLQVIGFITTRGFNSAIEEHLPLNFHLPQGISVLVLGAGLTIYFVIKRHTIRVAEVVEIAFLALLAVYSRRNALLFGVISFGVTAQALSELANAAIGVRRDSDRSRRRQAGAELLWVAGTLLVAAMVLLARQQPVSAREYYRSPSHPVQAVSFIRAHLPEFGDRMYNSYDLGGYLTFALPERKVFIDGRADFYGFEFTDEAIQIGHGENNALERLAHWNVDWVIVGSKEPLAQMLVEPAWRQVFRDRIATVFQRNRAAH